MVSPISASIKAALLKRIANWYYKLPRNSKIIVGIIAIFVGTYWINPLDLIGPFDDIIITMLGVLIQYIIGKLSKKSENKEQVAHEYPQNTDRPWIK